MTRSKLCLVAMLLALVGCTETIDSVTREYRNCINEGVDAVMMITDESSAATMRSRVMVHQIDRFKTIDGHLQVVKDNRTNQEFAKELLTSNGFQIYLMELEINLERLNLEVQRIESVAASYVKRKREEDNDKESTDEELRQRVCPTLHRFVRTREEAAKGDAPAELGTLYGQIKTPKLIQMFQNLPNIQNLKDLPKLMQDFEERKATVFARQKRG